MVDYLGKSFVTKDGVKEGVLDGKKVIGIYFSAHWCPPCKSFTPILAQAYNEMKEEDADGLEIVFVSSDQSQQQFEEYYGEMPWVAVPFGDERKGQLGSKFSVTGIPMLVIVNGSTGEVISTNGRGDVASQGPGALQGWLSKL